MKAIVAVDNEWGIGKDGDLLFRIKEDMKFFKETTLGKVVVMGRKTFESLPNKQPLKNRINLVVTSDKTLESYDNVIFGDMDKINEEIKKYDTNDIFIIGGASIYKQFIHRCDTVYVTHNEATYNADTYMPNLAFEGFQPKQVLDMGYIDRERDICWFIEEWITSESSHYTAVLWYKDSDKNITYLYSNDLETWNDIFAEESETITIDLKMKLRMASMGGTISKPIVVHEYYRYDYIGKNLRISGFGEDMVDAMLATSKALRSLIS